MENETQTKMLYEFNVFWKTAFGNAENTGSPKRERRGEKEDEGRGSSTCIAFSPKG
jgi:hypothetical protein